MADLSGGPGFRHDGVMHSLLSWITAAGRAVRALPGRLGQTLTAAGRALRALLQRLGPIRASVGGRPTSPGRCYR